MCVLFTKKERHSNGNCCDRPYQYVSLILSYILSRTPKIHTITNKWDGHRSANRHWLVPQQNHIQTTNCRIQRTNQPTELNEWKKVNEKKKQREGERERHWSVTIRFNLCNFCGISISNAIHPSLHISQSQTWSVQFVLFVNICDLLCFGLCFVLFCVSVCVCTEVLADVRSVFFWFDFLPLLLSCWYSVRMLFFACYFVYMHSRVVPFSSIFR